MSTTEEKEQAVAEGEHEEEATAHVLAPGHPSDGLRSQRMDGKYDRDEGAGPRGPGHLRECEEEQDRAGRVK